MKDPRWRGGRGRLRRWLAAVLPDDDWSAEFLHELDEELLRRTGNATGIGLTAWYIRQILSPATAGFLWAVWMRRKTMRDRAVATGTFVDLRQAWRGIARDRWVATMVVATLAVGIGSVSAMYGLADRLFLAGPPHVDQPEQVRRVFLTFEDVGGTRTSPWIPYNTALAIQNRVEAFEGVALYRTFEEVADLGDRARAVTAAEVDAAYFDVLGTVPVVGRFPGDDDSPQAAVLAEARALDAFGSARAALGRTVRVGEFTGTVVGVAPAGFAGPDITHIDVWLPIQRERAGFRNWWVTARMADARALEAATAEVQAVHASVDPGRSFQWARKGRARVVAVTDDLAGERSTESSIAVLLLAVVALMLVISWSNVLNLMLARLTRRRGEIVVRLALGIGRWRLARLLLAESLLLSVMAGLLSVPIAHAEGTLVRDVLLPGVAWRSTVLSSELLAVTFVAVIVSGLLLGLWPAHFARRTDLAGGLSRTRRSAGGGRTRLQAVLATGQVTVSAALLLCAGLFVKSFWTLRVTDLGVDASQLQVVTLRSFDYQLGSGAEAEDALYRRALESLRQRADLGRVALSVGLPFFTNFGMSIHVEGRDSIPELPGGGPFISAVSGGYFEAIGTQIVSGRAISDVDVAEGAPVTVVGRATAQALWPGGEAVGRCVRVGAPTDPCLSVIGIAEDVHRVGYREPPSLQLYVPLGSTGAFSGSVLLVRTDRTRGFSEAALSTAITRATPGIDYVDIRRLDSFLDPEIRPWRLGAVMLSMVSVVAVLVSLAGVFGVLSYLVAQRKRDIGVRIALGATRNEIQGYILRIGLTTGSVGVGLGFAAILSGSRWLSPLLFETRVADPWVMGVVAAGLVSAAALACLLPAAQAARVDPVASLRSEG